MLYCSPRLGLDSVYGRTNPSLGEPVEGCHACDPAEPGVGVGSGLRKLSGVNLEEALARGF